MSTQNAYEPLPFSLSLRHLRRACHISQEQAAAYLRISRQTYGSYERGERSMPPSVLLRCAALFHVAPEELGGDLTARFTQDKEEQDLLNSFRLLPKESRQQILSMIYYEIENPD